MFTKSANFNQNYLASIVNVQEFHKHSGADRLKIAKIYGNNVITGIDAQPGLYCFFPLESAISKQYLSFSNSFSDATLNANDLKKGLFGPNGRVKATRLRGEKSEGYMVPVADLEAFAKSVLKKKVVIDGTYEGTDFDMFLDTQFCQKYIPGNIKTPPVRNLKKTKGSTARYESKLVADQFRFHANTAQLKRNVHVLKPDDVIAITEKYHGTSFVVSHVLVKKPLNWKMKLAKLVGVPVTETEYGMLYSSRCVIKNKNMGDKRNDNSFYDTDIYKMVADKVFPHLKKGYTAYGEIVGYTPTGNMIQKGYSYGCAPSTLDYMVYRMTFTNVDGDVFELSHSQMAEYCRANDIKIPEVHYHGKAKDLYAYDPSDEVWNDKFLQFLIDQHLEKDCKYCEPNTPAEGVVLRIDKPNEWEVYKLKSFRFLQKESDELDSGVIDMETAQAEFLDALDDYIDASDEQSEIIYGKS